MSKTEEKGKEKTLMIVIGVLVVALIGSNVVTYISVQGQINTLNTQYQSYVSTHTYTNTEYSDLMDELDYYYEEYQFYYDLYNTYYDLYHDALADIDFYNNILQLNYEQVLVDQQTCYVSSGYWYWYWTYQVNYAGYLTVTVHSTSVANTYVRVIYNAYGVSFDQTIYVSAGQSASFPILPCAYLEVRVGNYYNIAPATYTVSSVFHY
ncbi:MAG: hypothetical protein QXH91_03035 [Candidatus Bathyarchaeia archaeon]